MPLYNLKLDSGREIRAVEFYQSCTYEGGLAIGTHSEERVNRKLDILKNMAKKIVPTPIIAILPTKLRKDSQNWCLPYYTTITWFVSDTAQDPNRHGSHLAVILFQDKTYPPFLPENKKLLMALDWDAHAEDFDY